MGFESFEEILDFAIAKEKEAAAFYEDIAQKAPFSGAREMLEEFAIEEQKHQALLENLGKDREKLDSYRFEGIPDLKRSDYILDKEYEGSMAYPEILRLAMKREENSVKLYRELIGMSLRDEVADALRLLAQEEAKHKLKLETMYDDYMAKQGD